MARGNLSRRLVQAADALGTFSRPQFTRTIPFRPRCLRAQCLSTSTSRAVELSDEAPEKFTAAPPIDFDDLDKPKPKKLNLSKLRVVPGSPSYFSAKPTFTDDFINLSNLFRRVATLPTVSASAAPRVAWKNIHQYRIMVNEPVKTMRYYRILDILQRLNRIHPSLMPEEVKQTMERYKKPAQPEDLKPNPVVVDELGRAKGVGRRKTSSAVAWVVEGDGEILVNDKTLSQFFSRLHDRESAVWALKATQRLDKYNVWALVKGGGVTGQAEALTLAVAKALMVHEPALKPALRRAGCVTRDPRKVERKKPGHVKARKMPTWVKR